MPVGPTKVIDDTISPELILMDIAGELLQRVVLLPAWLERLTVWLHRSLVRVDVASIYARMVVVGVIVLLPLHMTKVFGVSLTVVNRSVEMSCRLRRHDLTFERRWSVWSQWSWILGELPDTSRQWRFDE